MASREMASKAELFGVGSSSWGFSSLGKLEVFPCPEPRIVPLAGVGA